MTRRTADDDSAEMCRLITWRLLRQWTLDPGPAGLRLLAADLLAKDLTRSGTNTTTATPNQLARQLRAWRERYHDNADLSTTIKHGNIPLLRPHLGPDPEPWKYRNLLGALSWLVWTASATCAAALATLVCLPWCLSATFSMPRRYMARIFLCLIAATGILLIQIIWNFLAPESLAVDLRRLGSDELGWPRQSLAAAAVTLAILCILAVARMDASAPRRASLGRITYAAARIWLTLSIATLIFGIHTNRVWQSYETALRTTLDLDQVQAIVGLRPTPTDLLDGLHA